MEPRNVLSRAVCTAAIRVFLSTHLLLLLLFPLLHPCGRRRTHTRERFWGASLSTLGALPTKAPVWRIPGSNWWGTILPRWCWTGWSLQAQCRCPSTSIHLYRSNHLDFQRHAPHGRYFVIPKPIYTTACFGVSKEFEIKNHETRFSA